MAGEDSRNGSRKTSWTLGSLGALAIAVLAAWFGFGQDDGGGTTADTAGHTSARSSAAQSVSADSDTCPVTSLPGQAEEVISDVRTAGPFDYPENDGTHFGNYEGILPEEHNDFYREYTVETPGLDHRWARRIVTGGGTDTDPDTWYYTDDHYESFCEIPDAE